MQNKIFSKKRCKARCILILEKEQPPSLPNNDDIKCTERRRRTEEEKNILLFINAAQDWTMEPRTTMPMIAVSPPCTLRIHVCGVRVIFEPPPPFRKRQRQTSSLSIISQVLQTGKIVRWSKKSQKKSSFSRSYTATAVISSSLSISLSSSSSMIQMWFRKSQKQKAAIASIVKAMRRRRRRRSSLQNNQTMTKNYAQQHCISTHIRFTFYTILCCTLRTTTTTTQSHTHSNLNEGLLYFSLFTYYIASMIDFANVTKKEEKDGQNSKALKVKRKKESNSNNFRLIIIIKRDDPIEKRNTRCIFNASKLTRENFRASFIIRGPEFAN